MLLLLTQDSVTIRKGGPENEMATPLKDPEALFEENGAKCGLFRWSQIRRIQGGKRQSFLGEEIASIDGVKVEICLDLMWHFNEGSSYYQGGPVTRLPLFK